MEVAAEVAACLGEVVCYVHTCQSVWSFSLSMSLL